MIYSLHIGISLFLDALFGDPRWYPHPVRGIGYLIVRFEGLFRAKASSNYVAGLYTFISVLCAVFFVLYTLLSLAGSISQTIEALLAIIIIYMGVSIKDLVVHSNRVHRALVEENSLERARQEVAQIVGRDTRNLDEQQVTKACVETVAENMVDGITAPLFYAVAASFLSPLLPLSPIGCSALGIFLYKAVNTMDSMIGYKNEKYLEFGRVAAIADDLVNYIPARLSGLVLVGTAFVLRLNWKNALKIYSRDKNNHASPNAAHPEAAVAGALGVELGGPSFYFGELVKKPTIGDKLVEIEPEHIKTANRVVVVGTFLFAVALLFARGFILMITT